MARLDFQVRKETWVQWDLQDLLEDQEAQEDQVVLELKVSLDSQAETAPLVVLVVREKEVSLVSRDPQEPASHHQSQRGPKEILDSQVLQVFQVKKVSLVSLVILVCQVRMDAQDFLDHQVPKETLVSQGAQVVLEVQVLKEAWEKWDSQDRLGRRVYQVNPVDLELQDSQEVLVSQEPKVNQGLPELDPLDKLDRRVSLASQDSQEVQG